MSGSDRGLRLPATGKSAIAAEVRAVAPRKSVPAFDFHVKVDQLIAIAIKLAGDSMESHSLLLALIRKAGPWRHLPALQRLSVTTLLVTGTFLVWYLVSDAPTDARFIVFMPAVLAASLLFGRGAGFGAAIMSAALVLYQFVAPAGSLIPQDTTVVTLAIFLGTSALATSLIEALCGTVDRLSATNSLLEMVIEGSPEPIGVKDAAGRYVRANARMARLLGTHKDAVLGRHARDFLPTECATGCEAADQAVMSTGATRVSEELIGLGGQEPRCYLDSRAPWLGPQGEVLGIISIVRDIESIKQVERDLRAAHEHKDILLNDINHRIKNSLATVAGLLEVRRLEIDDPGANDAVSSSVRQLVVLSHVFDRLHQSSNKESIPVRAFLEDLCNDLRQSVVGDRIVLSARIDEAVLPMDRAISIGLIVNELVANALKYAFPDNRSGEIAVRLQSDAPASLCLVVEDDGIGFGSDRSEGTGRALVGALARQLGGGVEWRKSPGTAARIRFPAPADAAEAA